MPFELEETKELSREEQLELEVLQLKLLAARLSASNTHIRRKNSDLIRKTYLPHAQEEIHVS